MQLSAPIYYLKRKARLLSREKGIALHAALDLIAVEEGFCQWSLLAARAAASASASGLLGRLRPGDLVLLAARPGQGKTLMSLDVMVEAMKAGCRALFFTLECTAGDVKALLRAVGAEPDQFAGLLEINTSDEISADFIATRLVGVPRGAVVVVDYLQLLDQQRNKPILSDQVRTLKSLARERGLILIVLSQIDRTYDASARSCPDLQDVRLPNPLDLGLFNKACFLHAGKIRFHAAG